jgi:hypothetical protein
MSCIITVTDEPECQWMVQNRIYSWFIGLAERIEIDDRVREVLKGSEMVNGLHLPSLASENAKLAADVIRVLKNLASDIADGKYTYSQESHDEEDDVIRRRREKFRDLVTKLRTVGA